MSRKGHKRAAKRRLDEQLELKARQRRQGRRRALDPVDIEQRMLRRSRP